MGEIIKDEPSLKEFIDFCDKATKYYIEDRYPPGPPVMYSCDEIKESLDTACKLIEIIKGKTGIKG
jgi:HEPN domain-containing protein